MSISSSRICAAASVGESPRMLRHVTPGCCAIVRDTASSRLFAEQKTEKRVRSKKRRSGSKKKATG